MGPQSLTTRRRSRELSESLLKKVKLNPTKMSIDADEVKRICDIYDWHGKGVLDMYYFMDIFYAMGMNLTKKVCVKYGQTDDVEKKFLPFDEVVELAKKVVAELETFLSLMGDEIPKEDCAKLLESLADPEDEDGFFPYTPFLDKLCGK